MILSLYLSLTGLLQDRETIVSCWLFIMLEKCKKQADQYGSETLMGIVSISLLILALCGPVHLFNTVSWVENLQSRFTLEPPPHLPYYLFNQGSISVERRCFKAISKKVFVVLPKRLFSLLFSHFQLHTCTFTLSPLHFPSFKLSL